MKIVFTGTESTFKSTLAKAVAEEFSMSYIPEFARVYLEEIAPDTPVDPMPRSAYDRIEKGQLISQQNNHYFTQNGNVVFDTDGTVLHIWKQDKFGVTDPQLLDVPEDVIYFLCHPNVEACQDALRIDADRREELHLRYEALLRLLPNKVIHLNQESLEARLVHATKRTREILNHPV